MARLNGFSKPLHPLQIIAWIMIALDTLGFYLCIVPISPMRIVLGGLGGVNIVVVLVLGWRLTASNPTDPLTKVRVSDETSRYCGDCVSAVSENSKHCMRCDRCVVKFDHHCKWVNNCIG